MMGEYLNTMDDDQNIKDDDGEEDQDQEQEQHASPWQFTSVKGSVSVSA
jgi:hypothetical protein